MYVSAGFFSRLNLRLLRNLGARLVSTKPAHQSCNVHTAKDRSDDLAELRSNGSSSLSEPIVAWSATLASELFGLSSLSSNARRSGSLRGNAKLAQLIDRFSRVVFRRKNAS